MQTMTRNTVEPVRSDVAGDGRARAVRGPAGAPWQESTLTRAREMQALTAWVRHNGPFERSDALSDTGDLLSAIDDHLGAARQAAEQDIRRCRRAGVASLRERAMTNLDAAEAHLLSVAPPVYLLGQMASLLNHVQRHLRPGDPRRSEFEHIAGRLGMHVPDDRSDRHAGNRSPEERQREVALERGTIVSAVRAASSAAMREQLRVRSFRNVLVATTVALTVIAIGVAVMGFLSPTTIPLCFEPESGGEQMVVCPTAQTALTSVGRPGADVDDAVRRTAARADLLVVEGIGLAAAAVAAAVAIRGMRGSSERYGLPVALAVLKLPMGAMTAVLGLLLMRGQFVPGLSALDTSAQILAWALLFGYAQQLFTRLVDQQANTVLDAVRGAGNTEPAG